MKIQNKKFLILICCIFLALSSCAKKRLILSQTLDTPRVMGSSPSSSLNLFDPDKATAGIKNVDAQMDYYGNQFLLPSIQLEYQDHNYVNILRCGDKARSLIQSKINQANTRASERKSAWDELWGNPELCHPAKQNVTEVIYIDYTAPQGAFFYLINPCVTSGMSKTKIDQCSYRMSLTSSVEVKKSLSAEFRSKMSELEAAEAAHDAILAKVVDLQGLLASQKRDCEVVYQGSVFANEKADTTFNLATTGAATLGALTTRSLYNKIPKPDIKTPELLKSVNGKNWLPALLFSSAAALAIGIRELTEKKPEASSACNKVGETAQKILDIQKSIELKNSELALVSISKDLNAMDNTFQGYNDSILQISSLGDHTNSVK